MDSARRFKTRFASAAVLALVAGCASAPRAPAGPPGPAPTPPAAPQPAAEGLPPVPPLDGPLAITIVHPVQGQVRPGTDSVFVYGSVGTGRAVLTVNGRAVNVAPNGAFIAFLGRPPDDMLRLEARVGDQRVESVFAYRAPPPPGTTPPVSTTEYATSVTAVVAGVADTVGTGSDGAIGRTSPTGPYRWFLPAGARLSLTGERGDLVRARLDSTTEAWFPRTAVSGTGGLPSTTTAGTPTTRAGDRWTDVRIPVGHAPFRAELADTLLTLTLHGVAADFGRIEPADETVKLVEVAPLRGDAVLVRIYPARMIWGYRAYYEPDGSLVIRVRAPPLVDPDDAVRGVRIVVDPGHPPGGATGPTGLAEADANLGVGLRLAEHLRAMGAEVILTRSTAADVPLTTRVDQAVRSDADLLVSVHNNAFAEGADPFRGNGTSTYYFHPHSQRLARILNEEIVAVTRIRDLGAISDNLALVRPTWMPTALTESLFMPMPEQEAALRNTLFLERLAAAHAQGIARFLAEAVSSGKGQER